MVGKNQLSGAAEALEAFEFSRENAAFLQITGKPVPRFANKPPRFELAWQIALRAAQGVGQKNDFEQYAKDAEDGKAEAGGKQAVELA